MYETLSDFIERLGDEEAAQVLGIKPRMAQAYRLCFRIPRPDRAREFARRAPQLSVDSIYASQPRPRRKVRDDTA